MELQAVLEVLKEKISNTDDSLEEMDLDNDERFYEYAVGKLSAYREIESLVKDLLTED